MTIKPIRLLVLSLIVLSVGYAVSYSRFNAQSAFAKANVTDDILTEVASYRTWTRINAEPQEVGLSVFG